MLCSSIIPTHPLASTSSSHVFIFPHVGRTLFNHARSPSRRSGIFCFTTRPSVQRAATEYFNFRRQKGWLGLAGLCQFPDPKAPMGLWVQHPGQGGQGRRPLRPDDQKARRCRHYPSTPYRWDNPLFQSFSRISLLLYFLLCPNVKALSPYEGKKNLTRPSLSRSCRLGRQ